VTLLFVTYLSPSGYIAPPPRLAAVGCFIRGISRTVTAFDTPAPSLLLRCLVNTSFVHVLSLFAVNCTPVQTLPAFSACITSKAKLELIHLAVFSNVTILLFRLG
jgi:hypothetical protein